MLVLADVHCAYGKIEALKGISLEVKEGEIVTLIGANGAGKSTTLMTICGINHIKQGKIEFKGERIDTLPPHKIVAKGISQAPEGRRIFSRLTVLENLEMGAFTRSDTEVIRKDIDYVFGLFPILRDRQKQLGGTLSGGEQQMLAIGRALMAKPRLLLLDEPSLGLAPIVVSRIFDVIKSLNEQGVTIFLVEQNARMALRLAHRGYVIETGQITMADSAAALLDNPRVQEAYLGA